MGSKIFKHFYVAVALTMGVMLAACTPKNPNIEELKKNGKVHDAQIVSIDSLKGVCTYGFYYHDKEYTGQCLQPKDAPFQLQQYILVLFLERDPSINIRVNDTFNR